jgi:colanic acid biosynthesis glycosyl transferase WcaI
VKHPDRLTASRWLVLTQYYPPEVGAPQIRLRALVNELHRRGIAVEVLTAMPNYPTGVVQPGYEGRWRVREVIDGVPVLRTWIYAGAGRSVLVRLANYVSFTVTGGLAAFCIRRPDVIFVEAQPLSLGIIAVLARWLRRVPFIYNVPDLQVQVARQLGFITDSRLLSAAAALERFIAKRSWKVSTVTQEFKAHFRREGVAERKITFLPNGADTGFLYPQPADVELSTRFDVRGRTVFLYVGTMAHYHGLDTLLAAAARLAGRKDLLFLMIGQGPERKRLEAIAREQRLANVVFADSPYEERRRLYSIAHASIAMFRDIPVARQMRPAKVFPSLSCGVPIVYAGAGETANLVTATGCGVAVAPEDPIALADAFVALAHDRPRRDAMGRAGRALVERDYAWPTIVDRWLGELGLAIPSSAAANVAADPLSVT